MQVNNNNNNNNNNNKRTRATGAPTQVFKILSVAVFAPATGRAGEEAAHAHRWSTAVLNRFNASHTAAVALKAQGVLEATLHAGTASLVGLPAAKSAEVLMAGTAVPGATAQALLLTCDTRDGRRRARREREAALGRGVEGAFRRAHLYSFEHGRGRLTVARRAVVRSG